jgi:hypothetical protein
MTRQIISSEASRSGVFVYSGLCEYFNRMNNYCSAGQGRCIHSGLRDDCGMVKYYELKLEGVKPKSFETRYPNWRSSI